MSARALRWLAGALLLAVIALVAYRLSDRPGAPPALSAIRCDPGREICRADLPGGGQLSLAITPGPIRALQPLELRVTISGEEAKAALARAVEFTGRDMAMGRQRASLSLANGQFAGQAMLPVCISESMEWVASVLVTSPSGELREFAVPFHFKVDGPGAKP